MKTNTILLLNCVLLGGTPCFHTFAMETSSDQSHDSSEEDEEIRFLTEYPEFLIQKNSEFLEKIQSPDFLMIHTETQRDDAKQLYRQLEKRLLAIESKIGLFPYCMLKEKYMVLTNGQGVTFTY